MRLYDTHRWRKLRRLLLRNNPLCKRCENMGIVKVASVIDHTVPARVYDDFYNTNNLVPVCVQCHSDITKHYDNRNAHEHFENYKEIKYSGREFRIGLDGFTVDPRLDEKLLSLPIVGAAIPPQFENNRV